MRNAGMDETQAGIKIAGKNINNLRYAGDAILIAESKEELKSFLMKVKRRVKCWLGTQHSENEDHGIWFHHFMANRWETMERMKDFIFLDSKITADGYCSHEIKRCLLLERKAMINLDSILKSRDILLTKSHKAKAMVFPVVVYGCESWIIKKAECQRIDAFELWCWRRLLRVPWTARRSNQSILKEISAGCSLEGLMLKLNLQYFGHLMRRVDSL